jgi:hypothetical protein
MYCKKRKTHWDVRMLSKLEKLDECRMPINMGRREYFLWFLYNVVYPIGVALLS